MAPIELSAFFLFLYLFNFLLQLSTAFRIASGAHFATKNKNKIYKLWLISFPHSPHGDLMSLFAQILLTAFKQATVFSYFHNNSLRAVMLQPYNAF